MNLRLPSKYPTKWASVIFFLLVGICGLIVVKNDHLLDRINTKWDTGSSRIKNINSTGAQRDSRRIIDALSSVVTNKDRNASPADTAEASQRTSSTGKRPDRNAVPTDPAKDNQRTMTTVKSPECKLDKKKTGCTGECCEDLRIFERYFSKPIVCNGTYVEIGAIDGVFFSNTKFFEDYLGWTGVLIEGDPKHYKNLKLNRPRSIVRTMAICEEGVKKVKFTKDAVIGIGGRIELLGEEQIKHWNIKLDKNVEVPCMPMGRLLREAGITRIDFFSLDVEGSEMVVLETMDWTIPVKVFLVETQGPKKWINSIHDFFRKKGFRIVNRGPNEGCQQNTLYENINIFGQNRSHENYSVNKE